MPPFVMLESHPYHWSFPEFHHMALVPKLNQSNWYFHLNKEGQGQKRTDHDVDSNSQLPVAVSGPKILFYVTSGVLENICRILKELPHAKIYFTFNLLQLYNGI